MSSQHNERWIEAAWENLFQGIEHGNYVLCKDVIADSINAGFDEEAASMEDTLLNVPLSNFRIISPYQFI